LDASPLALRFGIKVDATANNRYGGIEVDDAGTKRNLVLQPFGGNVGIGITNPIFPLHAESSTEFFTAFFLNNTNSTNTTNAVCGAAYGAGSGDTKGGRFEAGGSGTGTNYGVHGMAMNATNNVGVYGVAGGSGTTNYGVYGSASGGTTNWAGYFVGNTYISGNLGIGTTNPGGKLELSLDQGRKPSTGTWTIVSDERLKDIKGPYTKGLNEILKLNAITYNYKNVGERTFEPEVLKTTAIGFSAQEVQKVFPEAVGVDPDGYLNFNMHAILVAYLNAFKEQQQQIESQQKTIEELIKRIEALEKK
jgi:hypothetical protein